MRVLLIKMSSMGDVFHTFPALSDAQANLPGLVVDWVVEKSFSEIPAWHPVVDKVYPIDLRQWRKAPFKKQTRQEIKSFFEAINQTQYDFIIDAQGLLKSAWVVRKIKGQKAGLDWPSVREPLASLFYDLKVSVDKNNHAIWRLRELFAKALKYPLPNESAIEYGLNTENWKPLENLRPQSYVVCLHGTTWNTKLWPEDYWVELLIALHQKGFNAVLPWGNAEEAQRANRIVMQVQQTIQNYQAWVPEQRLNLNEISRCLKFAKSVVSVDTGLSHVAAALNVPMVVLYRVTDPEKVAAIGQNVTHLISPIASQYVKKFNSSQQAKDSLQNLGVDDILKALDLKQGR